MAMLIRSLKAFGIVAGVVVFFVAITTFSSRYSLFYWALLSVFFLPAAFWFRLGFKKWCIALSVIAVGLALSPIDFAIQKSDRRGLQLLPISYGFACMPDTACYGCIIPPNPPRKALVLSY
jgi:hypothetical protein